MKKFLQAGFFLILISVVLTSISCEKDDVCLNPETTPKLVAVLYDYSNTTEKLPAEHFYLIALPMNDTLADYKNVTKDSLAFPLNVNQDSCSFLWVKDGNADQLDFSYQREEIFISKSCGYKTVFHQLQINLVPDTDNWIKNIEIVQPEITIDTLKHVKIYH